MNTENTKVLLLAITTTAVLATYIKRRIENRRNRSCWNKPWLNKTMGNLKITNEFKACNDLKAFKNYLRMDEPTFDKLLEKIEHRIKKTDTFFRNSISPTEKLIITLRYLATGESFMSLQYNFRISNSAISLFIPIVCKAIYDELRKAYLKVPSSAAEWLQIAKQYDELWNMPNCLGSLDGKHIEIHAQRKERSAFFNYKNKHSIVLLALVDAQYKFTYINVGMNGRVSDEGVFRESDLNKSILNNSLNFPEDRLLPLRTKPVPYVIVADAAFPLSTHILKPYPFHKMSKQQIIFNYRLSRARRVVENAFGILANRFRVLLNVNPVIPEKVKIVTQTCCALHNFLIYEMKTKYTGTYPEEEINRQFTFVYRLSSQAGNRPKVAAIQTREEYNRFFNGVGQVAWLQTSILMNISLIVKYLFEKN